MSRAAKTSAPAAVTPAAPSPTTQPAGRTAGAQYAKTMLHAIGAENERAGAASDWAELATPAMIAPIVEAHVAAANASDVRGFRGGFFEALGEWLGPTVDGCAYDLEAWQPLDPKNGKPLGQVPGAGEEAKADSSTMPSIWSLLDPVGSDLDAAIRLSRLAEWIEKARSITKAVTDATAYDEALVERLKQHRIVYNDAAWDEEQSVGLVYLHHEIRERMQAAREAADSARDADHAGRQS